MATQNINVTATNPVEFVQRLLELGAKGATLKERTCPRLKGLPYAAELVLEITGSDELQAGPGVNAIPVPMAIKVYTKEELEAMDWDTFRSAVQSKGVKGRQREVMTVKYLQAVESGIDESSEGDD